MLIASGVTAERGGRRALVAPDFRIAPHEAAVLTGPNGAGKTTLLRTLAGLTPLAAGDVSLDGRRLRDDRDGFLASVAFAGHLDAVKPALTVRENLTHWAAILGAGRGDGSGVDWGGVEGALARLSLTRIADAPAAFCSAGQRRRLGLARLLLAPRRLWLLDEPTVSLDAASAAAFAALVAEHCAAGGLALAATHVDIGLPDGPRIALAPPDAAGAAAADPFLAGAWT